MNRAFGKLIMFGMMSTAISIGAAAMPADGDHAGRARHPLQSQVRQNRQLQFRVDAAYEAATREFADELLGNGAPENPLFTARSEWQARIAGCADEGCRRSLLTEELNRLRFPFRVSRQHISRVPWQTGTFRIEFGDGGGGLQILPLIDDLILIRAGTSERRNADWICDLTAYGRIRPDGRAAMKAIGDDARFTLATGRRGELVLRPIGPEPNGRAGCPARGSLWGTYRPHYGR